MTNMNVKVNGSKLTIEIDLSKNFGPSATGKTITVASSHGNVDVPGYEGYKIGVNCYCYPDALENQNSTPRNSARKASAKKTARK